MFFQPNTCENPLNITCISKKIYTPTYEQLIKYFTYLNKKTFLTREFMKQKME